jgi:hypothetical protein
MIKGHEQLSNVDKYRMSQVLAGEKIVGVIGNKLGDTIILMESGCSFIITHAGYFKVVDQNTTKQQKEDCTREREAVFGMIEKGV